MRYYTLAPLFAPGLYKSLMINHHVSQYQTANHYLLKQGCSLSLQECFKMFLSGKMCYCPFFRHLDVIKCEYKGEMKCAWTAESNRMKSSVQLVLLCLSLLISNLHGEEEVKTDSSIEMPLSFDEPDLHQFEVRDKLCWQYIYWSIKLGQECCFNRHLSFSMDFLKYNSYIVFAK